MGVRAGGIAVPTLVVRCAAANDGGHAGNGGDRDDRVRLIPDGGSGVEFAHDAAGRTTIEWRGPVSGTAPKAQVARALAEVTYDYTDRLEVTGGTLRKY